MQKLQEMIDAASGKQAERVAQRPSEASLERERARGEHTRKIRSLKQTRLRSKQSTQGPAPLVFDVVRHRGYWRVLHNNRHSKAHSDQAAAILAATDLARKKRGLGHPVEVRLLRTDGQVVTQTLDQEQDG